MTARCLCDYADGYYMNWVSTKVLTDIRNELFGKMLSHSMDFFNRMRSGFLMSRITNDTRMMQTALSSVSSDVFKQPVTIISGLGVLLYMDWKFTVVTMILFPSCLIPLRMYGRRARKAVRGEQEELGQMVVTMQETFGGIRVVKSFGREEHQKKSFERSNRIQFDNAMRIVRSMQAIGPTRRDHCRGRRGDGLVLCLSRKPAGSQIHRPDQRYLHSLRSDQDPQSHSH